MYTILSSAQDRITERNETSKFNKSTNVTLFDNLNISFISPHRH